MFARTILFALYILYAVNADAFTHGSVCARATQSFTSVSQMLLMNSSSFNASYTIANLLAYVRAGFVVGNHAAFSGTGMGGADIGALAVS